jgi:hypothetical protein
MSIETTSESKVFDEEESACQININCYDPRKNRNEELPATRVHIEFQRKEWNKATGQVGVDIGLGGIDVVFDMSVAVQEFGLTNPLTGETVIGYGAYVDQILRQWSDQKHAEWNAQKEQKKIDVRTELGRLNNVDSETETT